LIGSTPNWRHLQDAYGTADSIPLLLADVSPNPHDEIWGQLWSRLCHQGSVYSASFAALPTLLTMAGSWVPTARLMPLTLAAAIIGSQDLRGSINAEEAHIQVHQTAPEFEKLAQ